MKKIWLILAIACPLVARAQTNSAATTNSALILPVVIQTNLPPGERPPTDIFSHSGRFNLKTRVATHIGDVRVEDPQMKMTCEYLTATMPPNGGRPDLIIAETNVVIKATDEKGNVIHATGERAVYTYKVENSATNELVELTGNPRVERQGLVTTGEKIIWNRITDDISVTQPHMTIQQDIKSAGTNAPAKGNP